MAREDLRPFVRGDARIQAGTTRAELAKRAKKSHLYRKVLARLEPKALRAINEVLTFSKDRGLKARVAQDLLDRIHGKAAQPIEYGEFVEGVRRMTDDQLVAFVRSLLVQAGLEDKVHVIEFREGEDVKTLEVVTEEGTPDAPAAR